MLEKNAKIFLVEDDPLIWDLYERAFRFMGYHIEIAVNGEEAVKMLDKMETLPSLILLDIMMPKMNGFEVLKHLKESERLKNIAVVMLTNLAGKEDAEKALELGALLYLVKSNYEPKQIIEEVEKVISKN